MLRILRPLLFLLAIGLLLATGRAADLDHTSGSRSDLQTAAPSGRVVVLYAPDATAADRARVAALAGAVIDPRFSADLLAASAAADDRGHAAALERLARYAQFDAHGLDRDALVRLVRRLAADPAVATAFLEPRPVPASLGFDAFTGESPRPVAATANQLPDLPASGLSATPDFSPLQGYLGPAPTGIGATGVWQQPGARGGSVRIVDVEGAWLWAHEDLPDPFVDLGQHINDLGWRNHGTAVVAQMRGSDNGYGVIGIVPDCEVGNSSIGNQSVAGALLSASLHLRPGDLILIELHAPGPNSYEGGGQFGYLPMEFWPDNFDVIRLITDRGIMVVEAAGNGQQDLDQPLYQGLFDRAVRDSGAIMVGATAGSALHAAWFTNHGTRVDLSGWGLNVVTAGYGDLQGGPETEWYTQYFAGTSSASPIVTGAAASLQGMVAAAFDLDLDAHLAAHILRTTGTPTSGPELIGPRPDLVAAWQLASQGVSRLLGTIAEQGSGLPVAGARVHVLPDGPATVTASDGSYQFGLLPGLHEIAVTSYYHATLTVTVDVSSGWNVQDFAISPLELVTFTGTVRGLDLAPLAGVELALLGEPVPAVYSGPDGAFSLPPVPLGMPRTLLAGGAPGYGGLAHEISAGAAGGSLLLRLPVVTYDFEGGPGGFQAVGGLWQHGDPSQAGVGPGSAFDGNLCWGVGLSGGGYPNNASAELWSPLHDGGQFPGDRLFLSFHYWCGTEAAYDGVNVVLDPAGSATVLHPLDGYTDLLLAGLGYQPGWSGTSAGWRLAIFDITPQLAEPSWRFALRFGSDGWVTDAGFLVDGITLHAIDSAVSVADPPVVTPVATSVAAWPNPFNPRVTVAWSQPAAGPLHLQVVDLRGRVVRHLLQGATVPASGEVTWDGTDQRGRPVGSGVYLVRLQAPQQRAAVQRITLTR
jgi:hypothetical protein